MTDWSKQHVSEWLFDTCRLLPEVNDIITAEVVKRNSAQPGKALAHLGLKDLRKLCAGSMSKFGNLKGVPEEAQTYWHASRIFNEIGLREEYLESYVHEAHPYNWPYNGIVHPGNTALIVIDMQRDFMEPGGYMNLVNPTWRPDESIIPPTQALLSRFRENGYHILHTREGHEPNMMDLPHNKYWRTRGTGTEGIGDGFIMTDTNGQKTGPFSRVLTRGYPGWELIEKCKPNVGETIIDKPTKGAFGNTEIELYLNTRNIQNLIFTGVTTDVCVSTIMREANDRGFECLLVTDATASAAKHVKEAIIHSIHLSNGIFGCTATSEQLLAALPRDENEVPGSE